MTNDDTDAPRWLSFPGFVPVLRHLNGGTHFANAEEASDAGALSVSDCRRAATFACVTMKQGMDRVVKILLVHVDIPRDIEKRRQVLQADTTLRSALEQRALR